MSSQKDRAKGFVILDADKNLQFHSIYEAINFVAGKNYKAWMRACWPSTYGSEKTNFRIWFPKLAEMKNGKLIPASFDCLNVLSDDWDEIVYDDLKKIDSANDPKYTGYDLIFAKEPSKGPYVFRGVFLYDREKSAQFHHVEKRIATKVKVIGTPAHTVELIS